MADPAPLQADWGAKARLLMARYIADNDEFLRRLPRPRRVSFIVWCDAEGDPREVTVELDTQRRVRAVR